MTAPPIPRPIGRACLLMNEGSLFGGEGIVELVELELVGLPGLGKMVGVMTTHVVGAGTTEVTRVIIIVRLAPFAGEGVDVIVGSEGEFVEETDVSASCSVVTGVSTPRYDGQHFHKTKHRNGSPLHTSDLKYFASIRTIRRNF